MSCRRAFEHDLPGFLADPRAPEHAGFRDHYPRCAACAAEVRAWTELAAALAAAAPAHPAPERLLRFADARGALAAGERAALEAHLAGCAACRDELAALARFDPAALAARAPAGDGGAGSWLAALRRALWHPAFAYALLLLLALPTVYTLVRPEPRGAGAPAAATAPARDADAGGTAEERAPAPDAVAKRAATSLERAQLAERDAATAEQAATASEASAPEPGQAETFAAQAPAAASAEAPSEAEAPRSFSIADAPRERAAAAAPAAESTPSAEASPLAAALAEATAPPLRFERRAGGLAALRLPVAPDAGEREVRLVAPDGRSLVQRLAPRAGALELLVAESWLGNGPHRVEIHGADGTTLHTALPPP